MDKFSMELLTGKKLPLKEKETRHPPTLIGTNIKEEKFPFRAMSFDIEHKSGNFVNLHQRKKFIEKTHKSLKKLGYDYVRFDLCGYCSYELARFDLRGCRTKYFKNIHRCSSCKNIYYCGKTCQKLDWIRHKKECKTKNRVGDNLECFLIHRGMLKALEMDKLESIYLDEFTAKFNLSKLNTKFYK